jgi:hypothetical protein
VTDSDFDMLRMLGTSVFSYSINRQSIVSCCCFLTMRLPRLPSGNEPSYIVEEGLSLVTRVLVRA